MNSFDLSLVTLLSAAYLYFSWRVIYNYCLNPLDPIFLNSYIAQFFSFTLIISLAISENLNKNVAILFLTVSIGYYFGVLSLKGFNTEKYKNYFLYFYSRVNPATINNFFLFSLFVTLPLSYLAFTQGAGGDERLYFSSVFRFYFVLHTGIFYLLIVLLGSPMIKGVRAYAYLILLLTAMLPFSSKSLFLNIAYLTALRLSLSNKAISIKNYFLLASLIFIGYAIVAFTNYRVESFSQLFFLAFHRFWMSGDVYIYAFSMDLLDLVKDQYDSFLAYISHPITSIFGVRGYRIPIGTAMFEAVLNSETSNGPNAQLPVVLSLFFGNNFIAIFIFSFFFGIFTFFTRYYNGIKNLFGMSVIIPVGFFMPLYGFTEFSLFLMEVIGAFGAATTFILIKYATEFMPYIKPNIMSPEKAGSID